MRVMRKLLQRRTFAIVLLSLFYSSGNMTAEIHAQQSTWTPYVEAGWEGFKRHYIFCGEQCGSDLGLVFDPHRGYEAVSEGSGYGLLMAVMMNDQATFDAIYNATYQVMFDDETGLFHWRVAQSGEILGWGSATDADGDIAMALIFAQHRVDSSQWTQHPTRHYDVSAHALIEAIWTHEVVDGRYLKPGDLFAGEGQDIINLSYFSPAWYRLFDRFQDTNRWQPVIDQGYDSLYATEGAQYGLAPDWSTAAGDPAWPHCDSIGRPREDCAYEMRYDAIRVPWRIGLDCAWFGEQRACEWTQRSLRFLNDIPSYQMGYMYDMQGQPVVQYQDVAMVGMWLIAAVVGDDPSLRAQLELRLRSFSANIIAYGYWADNPQYYYNQSLAWLSAAFLSGDFRNLLA